MGDKRKYTLTPEAIAARQKNGVKGGRPFIKCGWVYSEPHIVEGQGVSVSWHRCEYVKGHAEGHEGREDEELSALLKTASAVTIARIHKTGRV